MILVCIALSKIILRKAIAWVLTFEQWIMEMVAQGAILKILVDQVKVVISCCITNQFNLTKDFIAIKCWVERLFFCFLQTYNH